MNQSPKPIALVDLDGTIVDLLSPLKKFLLTYPTRFLINVERYDLGLSMEQFLDLLYSDQNLFRDAPIYPDIQAPIRTIVEKYHILIMTTRDIHNYPHVKRHTEDWLTKHTIPYTNLHFETCRKKSEIAKKLEVKIVFEDQLETALEMAKSNITTILIERSWNGKAEERRLVEEQNKYTYGEIDTLKKTHIHRVPWDKVSQTIQQISF